jgi:thioredoxin-like negative regulator of GroEL
VGFAERAVKVAPEDAGARDTLGWLLVQTGARDAGLRHLREARLRDPRNAETRYHLAAALAQAGQNKEAADELKGIFAAPLDFSEAADAEALGRRLGVR